MDLEITVGKVALAFTVFYGLLLLVAFLIDLYLSGAAGKGGDLVSHGPGASRGAKGTITG